VADIPTRIARVDLRVSDVEASASFYGELVGLEPASVTVERAELRPPGLNGGGGPCLVLIRAERPGRAPMRAAGLFHTAFRFRDRPSLAAALRRAAIELQHPLTGAADHGVSEALYLDDPDGLGIELYRDRPIEQWPERQPEERVHMFTAPLDLDDLLASDANAPAEIAALGVDIGHVHLKVADVGAAASFWTESAGMDLMTRFGPDAVFCGRDGYHHHIGANTWASRGQGLEPAEGPGLDRIAILVDEGEERAEPLVTPDGVPVETVARGARPAEESA
jgi:catechol 2,3-dioxygenase